MDPRTSDDPECPRQPPIPTVTCWVAADFSWSGIDQHSRKGSLLPGYLDAYGDHLRRLGLLSSHPSSKNPPHEG